MVESWYGLMAPAGTPAAVVNKIHEDTLRVLKTPELTEAFAKQGADVVWASPPVFGAIIATEKARWADVIRKSGAKID